MDDFNEPNFEIKDSAAREDLYRRRKNRIDEGTGKKKWVLPLALFLIAIVAVGIFLYFGNGTRIGLPGWLSERFAPDEETVQLTLPEALFAGKDIEEIIAGAVEEQGVKEVARGEDGALTYTVTAAVKKRLLGEAKNNLEDQITAMRDARQHPYVVNLSYDGAYKDFYLIVSQDHNGRALVTASELFMLVVYYQLISAAAEPAPEVSIIMEDTESGTVLEQLAYPADLNRAAAILEEPAELEEAVKTPQAGDKVIVTTGPDNLNLRNGPEITYLIIDILSSGTVLEVTGTEGVWLEVITPAGKEGWVHGDFVKIYLEDD